jgi:Protein of unknown function (DUF3617)
MTTHLSIARRLAAAIAAFAPGLVCAAQTSADQLAVTPGLYDITAQTLLPHLEDNLRDAKTRAQQCLGTPSATSLFPLLRHEAFAGCTLTQGRTQDDEQVFTLVCANPQAAGGQARFRVGAASLEGVLELKMGGKNMTLSQRIRGPRIGACQ